MAIKSRSRSTRLLMVTLVTISLVTITMDYRQGQKGPLEGLGKVALGVISPLQEGVSKITRPVGNFFSGLAHLPSLQGENTRLKEELNKARADLIEQSDLATENERLRGLLAMKEKLGTADTVTATVIASSPSNFEWGIVIDQGSRNGVNTGDAVIGSEGLVGHVVRTTPYSADVQLITDPDSKVAGKVVGTSETGLLSGQGQSDMRMGFVDPSISTDQLADATIETVPYQVGAESNRYPPGIPIGKVSRVLASFGSTEKFVTVRPTVDFGALDYVMVVVTPDEG